MTLPYDFEPLTDYLIDIHAVAKGAPANATGLVHRIGFTTSRFADVAELASYIAPASIEHRVVPVPAALAALPDSPTGAQVDEAYQAAGLARVAGARLPAGRGAVDRGRRPAARRGRARIERAAVALADRPDRDPCPADSPDPSHTYWAGRPADWLSVVGSAVPPAAGDQPRAGISRIVRGPGGTRAIAFLAAGARGCEARLDLRTAPDALAGTAAISVTAARVSLASAPWEVED